MPKHPGSKHDLMKNRQSPRLQLPKKRWPIGNGRASTSNPAQKFDSTKQIRGKPTIR